MNESQGVQKKITIDDIAAHLGCSKTTVSRAISGKGRISRDKRDEILDYCRECGYKPNIIAKSLAQSKTNNIGVILPSDQNIDAMPFFQRCLLGICETAASVNYDVVVTTVSGDDISRLQGLVENRKVDGVILTRSLVGDKAIAFLKNSELPFVVIGKAEDKAVLQIDNQHVEACRELTSTLIGRKMKRIAFIGGNETHTVSRKRYRGFMEGFEINQMEPKRDLVFLNCNTKVMVDRAVTDILERRSDCILCMDDNICLQVLRKLNEEHVQIPRDICVASFYDSLFLSSYNPPITVLRFDEEALGSASCSLLLNKMAGEAVSDKKLLEYEIVLKASTPNQR